MNETNAGASDLVEGRVDGAVIARGVTGLKRVDLANAGKGDGAYGVLIPFDLDPLVGAAADLVPDCLAAIGLGPALGTLAPPSNQAPHWATIELLRTLIDRDLEEAWDTAGLARAQPLRDLFEACLAERPGPVPKAQYLTPGQANELIALYNRDIAEIGRRTGFALPPQLPSDLPARQHLPAFDQVPIDILRDFRARAMAPDFVRSYPEAAAAVLSRGLADVSL